MKKVGLEIKDDYKQGIFLIDVFTEWCGPCKFVRPILEKLHKEGLFKLIAVDLDKNRALGQIRGVSSFS